MHKHPFLLFFLCLFSSQTFSQGAGNDKASGDHKYGKGFHFGLFVGSLFANKYSANLYDGYGLDADGFKNNFSNSEMARKILFEYGGGNGLPDRIAPALNCNHSDWTFDETDMPASMTYNAAIMVGLQMRYGLTKNDAVILNVNGSKLSVNGAFTIYVNNPSAVVSPTTDGPYRTFSIIGGEQRLVFQLGYQRLLGDVDKFNFFVEGGVTCTMAKFDKNLININGMIIDLTTYYNIYGNPEYHQKNLTGIGFGGFAGVGANLNISPKWTVQLVYDPSMEKINIGAAPKYTLQHTAGLRAYYVF